MSLSYTHLNQYYFNYDTEEQIITLYHTVFTFHISLGQLIVYDIALLFSFVPNIAFQWKVEKG